MFLADSTMNRFVFITNPAKDIRALDKWKYVQSAYNPILNWSYFEVAIMVYGT